MKKLITILFTLLLFSCHQEPELSTAATGGNGQIALPVPFNLLNGKWEHKEVWFNIESYTYEATIDTWEFIDSTSTLIIRSEQYKDYYSGNGIADAHSYHLLNYTVSSGALITTGNGFPVFIVPISVQGNTVNVQFNLNEDYYLEKIL